MLFSSQSKEELMKMYEDELDARRTEVHKNVAKVLTSYTGVWTDELIMSEIEWVPKCEYMYVYASSYFVRLVILRSVPNYLFWVEIKMQYPCPIQAIGEKKSRYLSISQV